MVRTLKEATVKSFHYETRADLEAHLRAYVVVYNLGKHLKGLRWRTPLQATCDAWAKDPSVFKADPHHLITGPYTDDDTDEMPGDDGVVHPGMYHFHSHGPDSLSEVSKAPMKGKEAGGAATDNTIGPWYPPNPLGYGDKYQYKLLDKDGGPMPAVYVIEDVSFGAGIPAPPRGLWKSLLTPAGNLDDFDWILLTGSPNSYPRGTGMTGSPALSGTHRYKGGIKTWSESRGSLVKTSTIKIWTDATQN